jgi:hypothetical protein|eukprot:COSAG01_NODE_20420_length_954_cov_1.858480_1_plen_136_part_00
MCLIAAAELASAHPQCCTRAALLRISVVRRLSNHVTSTRSWRAQMGGDSLAKRFAASNSSEARASEKPEHGDAAVKQFPTQPNFPPLELVNMWKCCETLLRQAIVVLTITRGGDHPLVQQAQGWLESKCLPLRQG